MNLLRRWALVLVALVCGATAQATAPIDFNLLRERVTADLAVGVDWSKAVPRAEAYISQMTPQGAWPDIDYVNRHITVWAPRKHLERLRAIALVFGTKDSGKFQDSTLRDALLRGLTHWQKAHPQSKNWWFNQILTPRLLGETLLLAQVGGVGVDDLPAGLLDRWAKEGGDPSKKAFNTTGSNRMALGEHWAYRGILTDDPKVLQVGLDALFSTLCFTDAEGLQRDFSFHQHGPQLYLGNYGYEWLSLATKWLAHVGGTPAAPDAASAALIRDYACRSFFPAIRGEWFLFNVIGRQQASRPGDPSARKVLPILRHLAAAFPADKQTFEVFAQRIRLDPAAPPPSAQSTVYPRSDYALHVRPAFTFDVRANSAHTARCEWGNNENLLGHYLSEGSTGFVARGDEYAEIAPLWDWFKVPGTTVVDKGRDKDIPRGKPWGRLGSATFVGGVDGVGALAFAYRRDKEMPGRFAWFAFGDAIVCLGAGISPKDKGPLITTIDQCWKHAPIPEEALKQGTLTTPASLVHGAFRYTIPRQSVTLRVSLDAREGSWSRVSSAEKKRVSGEVFTLWLDHGSMSKNAAYVYIVSPAALPEPKITILTNTPDLQTAQDAEGRLGIVAYKAGTFTVAGRKLTTERPCVALFTKEDGFVFIDPVTGESDFTCTLSQP